MKKSIKELWDSIIFRSDSSVKVVLDELVEREEESKAFVLNYMRRFSKEYDLFIDEENLWGHIYGIFLMAKFKEREFFPDFINLISMIHDEFDILYGDVLVENRAPILVSLYNGEFELIQEFMENEFASDTMRASVAEDLSKLAILGILDEKMVIDYYNYLLSNDDFDSEFVLGSVVLGLTHLGAKESIDIIKKAYNEGKVDENFLTLDEVIEDFQQDKEFLVNRAIEGINENIGDIYEILEFFIENDKVLFNMESSFGNVNNLFEEGIFPEFGVVETVVKEPKVGRNDNCPCGSGKKFKKCCLKN